jgi:general secretion pathway protein I
MKRERGFTLLELVVAFVIAALALSVFYQSALAGLGATNVASRYQEAVARAQSHLAALDAAPLVASDRQGDEGHGFHWHVRIAPTGTVDPAHRGDGAFSSRLTLYAVSVVISWGPSQRRQVRLDSQLLGPGS